MISNHRILNGLSWVALIVGLLVYLGWAFGIAPLQSFLPSLPTMKANTALCFILLGAASLLRRSASPPAKIWVRILTLVTLLIAALTLIEIVFNINLGIDEFPFADEISRAGEVPGRMSAPATLSFLLLSLSSLFEDRWSDRLRRSLAVIVLALGLCVLLSYPFGLAYGTSLFSYVGMALHSSVLLVILSVLQIVEIPDRGWMDFILVRTTLGENTRRLLATVLVVPFLLGWLIFYGESAGWYGAALSRSTYAVALMLLFALVVFYNANRLQHAEDTHRLLRTDLNSVSRQLNTLVENSPSAIFVKDADGRYRMVNSHFEHLVQKGRAEILGRKAEAIFSSALLPAVLESDRLVMDTLDTVNIEVPAELDGEARTYLDTKFPLLDESGTLVGLGGIWTDISEQKLLAESLYLKNVDLERSNKELEQFAYVASHDLQEPLRMVSSYMQLLESRYKHQLDSDAKEFIDYAVDGAARMQRLIQDLLAFSRVGTRGREPEVVPAADPLAEALRNLELRIEENQAQVGHAELPLVFVDPNQLTQVFQNLIGNAVKFRGQAAPLIAITSKDAGDFVEFAVADNGIGFEQKHTDRIFTIFQRLNSREQYEGTGIGLSICKKIVERHGGRIWAESTPGKGSTFRFTLPRPRGQVAEALEQQERSQAAQADAQAAESLGERAGRML